MKSLFVIIGGDYNINDYVHKDLIEFIEVNLSNPNLKSIQILSIFEHNENSNEKIIDKSMIITKLLSCKKIQNIPNEAFGARGGGGGSPAGNSLVGVEGTGSIRDGHKSQSTQNSQSPPVTPVHSNNNTRTNNNSTRNTTNNRNNRNNKTKLKARLNSILELETIFLQMSFVLCCPIYYKIRHIDGLTHLYVHDATGTHTSPTQKKSLFLCLEKYKREKEGLNHLTVRDYKISNIKNMRSDKSLNNGSNKYSLSNDDRAKFNIKYNIIIRFYKMCIIEIIRLHAREITRSGINETNINSKLKTQLNLLINQLEMFAKFKKIGAITLLKELINFKYFDDYKQLYLNNLGKLNNLSNINEGIPGSHRNLNENLHKCLQLCIKEISELHHKEQQNRFINDALETTNTNLAGGSNKKYIKLKSGGRRLIRYGKRGGRYYIKQNKKIYIK